MINFRIIWTIYHFEMARMWRTKAQSLASPVLSTVLYFVVFGPVIGKKISTINGIPYAAFITPGLIMLSALTQSVSTASFGIYFPRFNGSINEILSAPISYLEIVIGHVGAAASKAFIIGMTVFMTTKLFINIEVMHPIIMLSFLSLTTITFGLLGFILGIWADGFEQLQIVPLLVITPLTFLGGTFYSIKMLPPIWQKLSMFNPVVYLINGLRWSFYEQSDISLITSFSFIGIFLLTFLAIISYIFHTGYRLKS